MLHSQTFPFLQAEIISNAEHPGQSGQHGRNHGIEQLQRAEVQRGHRPGGRTAPGNNVHDPRCQADRAGQHQPSHFQAFIERQHRRNGDHKGGGAVAVERDRNGQKRRGNNDLQRVALDQTDQFIHHGLEQSHFQHESEVENRKHDHNAGRGDFDQARQHHFPHAGTESAQRGGNHRHDDQGRRHRHASAHNHRQKRQNC